MPVNRVLAGIAVGNFDALLAWYERFLGGPPDERPMDGLVEWHFPDTGWIQLIHDTDRAGRSLLTLQVDDLEQHLAELRERELDPGPVDTRSEKVLFVTMNDPEGNAITLVSVRTS
jgi:hypothetical protein